VALDGMQIGAAAPVPDVPVGPHEVLRRLVDAESGERPAVDVV